MHKQVLYIKSIQLRDLINTSDLDINILMNIFLSKLIVVSAVSLCKSGIDNDKLDQLLKYFGKKHKTVYYCAVANTDKNGGWFNCFFGGSIDEIMQTINRTIKYKALL